MLSLPALARRGARAVMPAAALDAYRASKLVRRATRLGELAAAAVTAEQRWDVITGFPEFCPYQKKSELVRFVRLVASVRPLAICEIGAASGGTLCAMSHAADQSAVVISVDIDFTPARLRALPHVGLPTQTLTCIAGDSHQSAVFSRVASILRGRPLDVLFIDGDHSHAGVKADYDAYRTLVRPGGLIAFHDIVPDARSRFGTPTASDSGGVPLFWQELKAGHADVEEIVEGAEQDGYGIGVLRCPV